MAPERSTPDHDLDAIKARLVTPAVDTSANPVAPESTPKPKNPDRLKGVFRALGTLLEKSGLTWSDTRFETPPTTPPTATPGPEASPAAVASTAQPKPEPHGGASAPSTHPEQAPPNEPVIPEGQKLALDYILDNYGLVTKIIDANPALLGAYKPVFENARAIKLKTPNALNSYIAAAGPESVRFMQLVRQLNIAAGPDIAAFQPPYDTILTSSERTIMPGLPVESLPQYFELAELISESDALEKELIKYRQNEDITDGKAVADTLALIKRIRTDIQESVNGALSITTFTELRELLNTLIRLRRDGVNVALSEGATPRTVDDLMAQNATYTSEMASIAEIDRTEALTEAQRDWLKRLGGILSRENLIEWSKENLNWYVAAGGVAGSIMPFVPVEALQDGMVKNSLILIGALLLGESPLVLYIKGGAAHKATTSASEFSKRIFTKIFTAADRNASENISKRVQNFAMGALIPSLLFMAVTAYSAPEKATTVESGTSPAVVMVETPTPTSTETATDTAQPTATETVLPTATNTSETTATATSTANNEDEIPPADSAETPDASTTLTRVPTRERENPPPTPTPQGTPTPTETHRTSGDVTIGGEVYEYYFDRGEPGLSPGDVVLKGTELYAISNTSEYPVPISAESLVKIPTSVTELDGATIEVQRVGEVGQGERYLVLFLLPGESSSPRYYAVSLDAQYSILEQGSIVPVGPDDVKLISAAGYIPLPLLDSNIFDVIDPLILNGTTFKADGMYFAQPATATPSPAATETVAPTTTLTPVSESTATSVPEVVPSVEVTATQQLKVTPTATSTTGVTETVTATVAATPTETPTSEPTPEFILINGEKVLLPETYQDLNRFEATLVDIPGSTDFYMSFDLNEDDTSIGDYVLRLGWEKDDNNRTYLVIRSQGVVTGIDEDGELIVKPATSLYASGKNLVPEDLNPEEIENLDKRPTRTPTQISTPAKTATSTATQTAAPTLTPTSTATVPVSTPTTVPTATSQPTATATQVAKAVPTQGGESKLPPTPTETPESEKEGGISSGALGDLMDTITDDDRNEEKNGKIDN